MGPKPSPNPGKTARYYRSNPKARAKHVRDNTKINLLPPQPPKKWWQKLNPLNK